MKNSTIKAILIIAIIVGVLLFVAAIINSRSSTNQMMDKLIPFILKKEGGLSRDPQDTASKNPAPWPYDNGNGMQTGWHTNKGVTYTTFIGNASKAGYAPTADNFFKMPNNVWRPVLRAYEEAFPIERIKHLPKIQAVIITWAWGSGPHGTETRLARFQREVMGIEDDNITRAEIVENFRRRITRANEEMWFQKLNDRRAEDFAKMPTFSAHGRGWLKTLKRFRVLFD